MKSYFLLLLACAGCAVESAKTEVVEQPSESVASESEIGKAYRTGFSDGWIAHSCDSLAIDNFMRELEYMERPVPQKEQDEIWAKCVQQADETYDDWAAMTADDRANYPINPFWQSGNGTPRSGLFYLPASVEAE